MARKANTSNNNKEEIKIRKFIVEAPEPQNDQKVSSGGIRNKNGELASQFKNPVPYNEPTQPPTIVNCTNAKMIRKEQARVLRNEAGMYLLSIVWQEFGEPLFRSVLHKLEQKIIGKLEAPKTLLIHQVSTLKPEMIDVEVDKIETVYNDDKIINFFNRKVI